MSFYVCPNKDSKITVTFLKEISPCPKCGSKMILVKDALHYTERIWNWKGLGIDVDRALYGIKPDTDKTVKESVAEWLDLTDEEVSYVESLLRIIETKDLDLSEEIITIKLPKEQIFDIHQLYRRLQKRMNKAISQISDNEKDYSKEFQHRENALKLLTMNIDPLNSGTIEVVRQGIDYLKNIKYDRLRKELHDSIIKKYSKYADHVVGKSTYEYP